MIVKPDGRYSPRTGDLVINWGNCNLPTWYPEAVTASPVIEILNNPLNIKYCVNKILAFDLLRYADISVPDFTSDPLVAKEWDGKILARTLTRSSGGKGIVICDKNNLVPAKLYVKYIEKDAEYRVHIFKGQCIDYAKKVQNKEDATEEEKMIANHDNGWYFMRDVKRLDENINLAKEAIQTLGLDFGAVDIIRKDKVSYVLEVNTAPGLNGISLDAYADAIVGKLNSCDHFCTSFCQSVEDCPCVEHEHNNQRH